MGYNNDECLEDVSMPELSISDDECDDLPDPPRENLGNDFHRFQNEIANIQQYIQQAAHGNEVGNLRPCPARRSPPAHMRSPPANLRFPAENIRHQDIVPPACPNIYNPQIEPRVIQPPDWPDDLDNNFLEDQQPEFMDDERVFPDDFPPPQEPPDWPNDFFDEDFIEEQQPEFIDDDFQLPPEPLPPPDWPQDIYDEDFIEDEDPEFVDEGFQSPPRYCPPPVFEPNPDDLFNVGYNEDDCLLEDIEQDLVNDSNPQFEEPCQYPNDHSFAGVAEMFREDSYEQELSRSQDICDWSDLHNLTADFNPQFNSSANEVLSRSFPGARGPGPAPRGRNRTFGGIRAGPFDPRDITDDNIAEEVSNAMAYERYLLCGDAPTRNPSFGATRAFQNNAPCEERPPPPQAPSLGSTYFMHRSAPLSMPGPSSGTHRPATFRAPCPNLEGTRVIHRPAPLPMPGPSSDTYRSAILPATCPNLEGTRVVHRPLPMAVPSSGTHRPATFRAPCPNLESTWVIHKPSPMPRPSSGVDRPAILPPSCPNLERRSVIHRPARLPMPGPSSGTHCPAILPGPCPNLERRRVIHRSARLPMPGPSSSTHRPAPLPMPGPHRPAILPSPCIYRPAPSPMPGPSSAGASIMHRPFPISGPSFRGARAMQCPFPALDASSGRAYVINRSAPLPLPPQVRYNQGAVSTLQPGTSGQTSSRTMIIQSTSTLTITNMTYPRTAPRNVYRDRSNVDDNKIWEPLIPKFCNK